ncbi:hypothetical protein BaRGS_00040496, partial [Batillaria attramentaria]
YDQLEMCFFESDDVLSISNRSYDVGVVGLCFASLGHSIPISMAQLGAERRRECMAGREAGGFVATSSSRRLCKSGWRAGEKRLVAQNLLAGFYRSALGALSKKGQQRASMVKAGQGTGCRREGGLWQKGTSCNGSRPAAGKTF